MDAITPPNPREPDPPDSSPIRSLPTEILQRILSLDPDATSFYPSSGSTYPQLRLIHVDRSWRYAALGVRSLWTEIRIDETLCRSNPNCASDIRKFLQFPGGKHLDVSILSKAPDIVAPDQTLSDAISPLLEVAQCWKTAKFYRQENLHIFDLLRDRLTTLRRLEIFVSGYDCVRVNLGGLPSLRRLVVHNVVLADFPWPQLEFVNADYFLSALQLDVDIIKGVVNGAKQLKTLQVVMGGITPPRALSAENSSVTRVTLDWNDDCQHFTFPNLRHLILCDDLPIGWGATPVSRDNARQLIERSKCSITSLQLKSCHPSHLGDLRRLLRDLDSLKDLKVNMSVHPYQAISTLCDFLTPGSKGATSLPSLEYLCITCVLGEDQEFHPVAEDAIHALAQMLRTRPTSGSTLAYFVQARWRTRASEDDPWDYAQVESEALKELQEAYLGQMEVHIQTTDDALPSFARNMTELWLGRTREPIYSVQVQYQ